MFVTSPLFLSASTSFSVFCLASTSASDRSTPSAFTYKSIKATSAGPYAAAFAGIEIAGTLPSLVNIVFSLLSKIVGDRHTRCNKSQAGRPPSFQSDRRVNQHPVLDADL